MCVCRFYVKSEGEGKFSRRSHAKNTSWRIILSRGGIIEFAQDVFQVIARITLRESRARASRARGRRTDEREGTGCEILSSFLQHARAPRRARVFKMISAEQEPRMKSHNDTLLMSR